MKLFRKEDEIDKDKYIRAEYFIESAGNLREAVWALAVGQSIGNPTVRNKRETEALTAEHAALILASEKELKKKKKGRVKIAFPSANINFEEDGVTQLLVQLMGGQMDIDLFVKCYLLDIEFPKAFNFKGPRFGIEGIRQYTDVKGRPLLGGIIKPKVGMKPRQLLKVVRAMVEGGVDFIKEDEIMASPSCCPLEKRVKPVMDYLEDQSKKIIYAVCVNGDYPYVIKKVKNLNSSYYSFLKLSTNSFFLYL